MAYGTHTMHSRTNPSKCCGTLPCMITVYEMPRLDEIWLLIGVSVSKDSDQSYQ